MYDMAQIVMIMVVIIIIMALIQGYVILWRKITMANNF